MTRRLSILAYFSLFLLTVHAGYPEEYKFLWDEANSRMVSARTSGDALLAAESYARLLDRDVRNGALFYNMGTALLLAGRHAEAVNMFLRAERYEGAQPDISRNLHIAIARLEKNGMPGYHWTRTILFWHYPLPAKERGLVAFISFFVFWLALTVRQLWRLPGARIIAGVALVLCFAFGMSFAVTLYQEASAQPPSFAPPKIKTSDAP